MAPVRKKTRTLKSQARIVRAGGPEQYRLFSYLFFNFIQRMDLKRRETYAGDIELATISEAIALSAIEPLMRDAAHREEFRNVKHVVGVERQRGVNALSVSAATGIPRETTRRKIKQLIELGAIMEVNRGQYIMKPGFLQQDIMLARFDQVVNDTARFFNDALDQGIFEWSLAPEPDKSAG